MDFTPNTDLPEGGAELSRAPLHGLPAKIAAEHAAWCADLREAASLRHEVTSATADLESRKSNSRATLERMEREITAQIVDFLIANIPPIEADAAATLKHGDAAYATVSEAIASAPGVDDAVRDALAATNASLWTTHLEGLEIAVDDFAAELKEKATRLAEKTDAAPTVAATTDAPAFDESAVTAPEIRVSGGGVAALAAYLTQLAAARAATREEIDRLRYEKADTLRSLSAFNKREHQEAKELELDCFKGAAPLLFEPVDNLDRAVKSCNDSADLFDQAVDAADLSDEVRFLLKLASRAQWTKHADAVGAVTGSLLELLNEDLGVDVIEAAYGTPFNRSLHDSARRIPSEDFDVDTVVQQLRRGFRHGEQTLRPAQVIVARRPRT